MSKWKKVHILKRIKRKIRKKLWATKPVNFKDSNFEKAVLMSTEHKSNYYITYSEAEKCTNIIASIWTHVKDLNGIQAFSNLENAFLHCNHIKDLSPLSRCRKLRYFCISSNDLSVLVPLRRCVNLRQLHLDANHISDLTPLSDLPWLEDLSLTYNWELRDISPLITIPFLKKLDVSHTSVEHIAELGDFLIHIDELDLSATPAAKNEKEYINQVNKCRENAHKLPIKY